MASRPKPRKVPSPPMPTPLREPPPRPGENGRGGAADQAKHAGITVVDWVDERTSLTAPPAG